MDDKEIIANLTKELADLNKEYRNTLKDYVEKFAHLSMQLLSSYIPESQPMLNQGDEIDPGLMAGSIDHDHAESD